jgi:hypothetical protein
LPGLLRAQDVSHFHSVAGHIRNIDEANAKKREFEDAQKQKTDLANPSNISAAEPIAAESDAQNEREGQGNRTRNRPRRSAS